MILIFSSSKSLKYINKKVNFELKNIVHWLRANKISLNTSKTDLILFFRSKRKQITKQLNFLISGQKIKIACKTKYLGLLLLDETLNFRSHIDSLKTILRQANCLLSKIRLCQKRSLKDNYYALFDSHLRYGWQIWGQCQT